MSNIYQFNDFSYTQNDLIMLDTSVLLSYLGHDTYKNATNSSTLTAQRKRDSERLIFEATKAGSIVVISTQLAIELRSVLSKDIFSASGYKGEYDRKQLRKINPNKYNNLIGQANNDAQAFLCKFMKSPAVYNEIVGNIDSDTVLRASEIQNQFNLHGLGDAIHIAIAEKEGINNFATMDADFKDINNGMNILTDRHTYNKINNL